MQFKNKILLWFSIASVILVSDAYFIYRNFVNLDENKHAIIQTHQTLETLENIISSIKDVHGSQRGYIITGLHDYLAPYTLALPKIQHDFELLEQTFADNPEQLKLLQQAQAETKKRIDTAAEIIGAYDKQGAEAAFTLVRAGHGKREMDEIRYLINEMTNNERLALFSRRAMADNALNMTLYVSGGGLFICFVILGSVFIMIGRENRLRSASEENLKHALTRMETLSQDNLHISHMAEYLQSCQKPEEAYAILEEVMPSMFTDTHGSASIFSNSRNMVESVLKWGDTEERHHTVSNEFMPQECWALRRGQIHYYKRGGADPLCPHIVGTPECALCLPMQAHGETVGLLHIASGTAGALEDDRTQNLAKRISEQTSLAISNLKLQHKLLIQSTHDPLTHLFNRRYLETTLDREISRARRGGQSVCVLVLDVDHFKKFNDTRGHDAGDALLVGFAKLLQEKTRKEDIVCRYGGEEFVVVLPGASPEMGLQHAERLCAATRDMQVTFNGQPLGTITVSIGVAAYPGHGEKQDELIARADAALYEAKHSGRDQAVLAAFTAK